MSQDGKKPEPRWPKTSLMTSLTKNPKPKTKKKFFLLQTRRLAESFKVLNSSAAQSAEELCGW